MGIPTLIKTLTASNSASLEFVDGTADVVFDSTYDEYMFVYTDINPATLGAIFTFRVNPTDDAGGDYDTVLTTSTAFAAAHSEGGSGAALAYQGNYDLAQNAGQITLAREGGADADESCAGILHIFSPSSTTYVKHFYSRSNQANNDTDPVSQHFFVAGYMNDTTAIDEIQFKFSSGNFDGVIQLYGIA